MNLSLCMIVKNEAKTLPRCLASVQGSVDEMIVLDTGSTDETVAIAQAAGAQVHHFVWTNNFAEARNASLTHATGDWILVLDADERLAEGIGDTLRQTIENQQALVVTLVRQEIGATQSPYSLVSRLFRNHPDIRFDRPYHAMIDDSVAKILQQEADWQVIQIPDVAILHDGYAPGAIASRNKLDTARFTMERFLVEHPGDPYVCSKLGALYVQLGRAHNGIELLERGLKSDALEPPVYYELYYHLGIAYSRMGHLAQAAHAYERAIQQPILPRLKLGAYSNLGCLRQLSSDLTGAKVLFEKVITIDPTFAIGHYNLGMTLKALGQFSEAIAHYQTAIRLDPTHPDAHQNLGVVWFKLGKMPEGLAAFRTAINLHYQHLNPREAKRLQEGLNQMGFSI
ncbi:MAG: tetratricopeptide repeat protein [Elainellaceae cyanobacterium]